MRDRVATKSDANRSEVLKIAQRLAQRSAQQERAVDITHDPIVERNPQTVSFQRLDIGDSEHRVHATAAGRSGPAARALAPAPSYPRARRCAALPIRAQFAAPGVASDPVEDLKGAELDLGDVLAVLGVEMRRRVIGPIRVPARSGFRVAASALVDTVRRNRSAGASFRGLARRGSPPTSWVDVP
jgi:hypothetical protein